MTAKHKRAITTKLFIDIPKCITKHQVFRLYVSNDADYPGVAIYPYKKPGWFMKGWVETNPRIDYEEEEALNKVDVDYSLTNLAKRELAWNTLEFTSAFHIQGNITFPLKVFIPELVDMTSLTIMFKTGPWACSHPYSDILKIAPDRFPTILVSGGTTQHLGLILLLATHIILL
ncbi:hypothetical protein DSO57_1013503 [Entomophthora muscae]|uniref:Uncharacterized protein n=1 Tax=Entomophthora muscae TaxID=34485 RepID=A0ACC2TGG9_9FUNG|nr:hypothetical protein DSO57_1013503 [Entomophthora muscae]